MNGHYFMNELSLQVQAVKALGDTHNNWGVSYHMYNEAEKKLGDFIRRNKHNIVSCLDVVFTNLWISTEDRAAAFISLYESGDYDEALSMLCYTTIWKYRRELEHVEITL